jgi:hypothetical protein
MPIRVAKEVVGVITIDRVSERAGGGFNDDIRLMTMTASLVGQALALQRTVLAERNQLISESRRLRHELKGRFRLDNVIGVSKRMQDVFAEVHQAGPSRSTVLLRGESGTGKEVIARALHTLSPRKDGPFVKVNCAALTESLLESELFGHEKAASRARSASEKGASRWPTRARFSSTRSVISPPRFRQNCCVCCRSGSSSGLVETGRSRWTCVWCSPPIAIWRRWWRRVSSAPTCITASMS